ncbi:class I SAM-dependent methyltransferase [Henriciella aquimarina]|uniref:class I SAM-dependent methyltransferase n=1 Tax=Henriciella aquimarina TaxID=545261 RepID=UPI000A05BB35|nr:class I SAM-dependent methyltransferase [Henriciella aquimarina]
MTKFILTGTASLLLLAACANQKDAGLAPADVPEPPIFEEEMPEAAINEAIVAPERPETDVERDELRKPAAVLDFMGIHPGVDLLEMEAGSGYFTEIFSRYLGPDGTLYMQNPAAFDSFLGDSVDERLDGLDNVEYVKTDFDELPFEEGAIDVVTWFQGPHELWYTPESGTKLVGNANAAFPEIMRVLKPGGTFVVIDHSAPAGAPPETGGETHRIDPQIVKDMADEAGFVLIAESDLYDNPEDDLNASVFDEKVRGRTDQFLLKFEKPAVAGE